MFEEIVVVEVVVNLVRIVLLLLRIEED